MTRLLRSGPGFPYPVGFLLCLAVWLASPACDGAEYQWINVTNSAAYAPRDGAGALVYGGRMWLLGGWNPGDKRQVGTRSSRHETDQYGKHGGGDPEFPQQDLEQEKNEYSFKVRYEMLDALGLEQVKAYRKRMLQKEEAAWRTEFEGQKLVMPELHPLVLLRIG